MEELKQNLEYKELCDKVKDLVTNFLMVMTNKMMLRIKKS